MPTDDKSTVLRNATFAATLRAGAVVSLRRNDDAFETDYIRDEARFGDVVVRYRTGAGPWVQAATAEMTPQPIEGDSQDAASHGVVWAFEGDGGVRFDIVSRFVLADGLLRWTLEAVNRGQAPVEIGDLAFDCPMNSSYEWDREVTYNQRVIRHSLICGAGAFLYWMRCNAIGPYLVMTPGPATRLEYFDIDRKSDSDGGAYNVYIHSAARTDVLAEKGTRWRVERTSATLAPAGTDGHTRAYDFTLEWADGHEQVRDVLVERGLFDVQVVPGMTVPAGTEVQIAVRTRSPLAGVEAEHGEQTALAQPRQAGDETTIYAATFSRLGENVLTLVCADGRRMTLEFFVTEPIETLIRKRAAFLVDRQQIRDENVWYDGLISDWNMDNHVLLSPDEMDRVPEGRRYMITCDDPGLCRAPFVAAKNVEHPDAGQVEALEYYITRFVWGGLQMTDEESHPFGVYGIHDWKTLRESDEAGPKGRLHIWRIYDYPHMILLYLSMYRIASRYPEMCQALTASEYLRRAAGTARAYYTYPPQVADWTPYKTGTYNELVIEDLIDELRAAGLDDQADEIRTHWETKVMNFATGKTNLFGSEYPFDSTGFESTHAFARYAMRHAGASLDLTGEQARAFLDRQMELNVGCRGWLEVGYPLYGSDIRGAGNAFYTLSYMAQMGGWGVMDYALYWADDPYAYLRLGYASILSSWALMNTGTAESDYGYWYGGVENDGGAGGGFEPAPYGKTWLQQEHHRGSWYYGCEIDLGFSGALRAAACVLADDPLFGEMAYGGALVRDGQAVSVVPQDGVRRRFHVLRGPSRLHVTLDRDHFAAETPIILADDLSTLSFVVETSASADDHVTTVRLAGLPAGRYSVTVGGETTDLQVSADAEHAVALALSAPRSDVTIARS